MVIGGYKLSSMDNKSEENDDDASGIFID